MFLPMFPVGTHLHQFKRYVSVLMFVCMIKGGVPTCCFDRQRTSVYYVYRYILKYYMYMNSIYDYLCILYDEVRVIKTPREGLKTVFSFFDVIIHLSRFNTSDNYNNFFLHNN